MPLLERELRGEDDDGVRLKLIVCYVQTGRTQAALKLGASMLRRDPLSLIGVDPDGTRHNCSYLAAEMTTTPPATPDNLSRAGLLYLYCRPPMALHYLSRSLELDPNQVTVAEISEILEATISERHMQPSTTGRHPRP